MVMYETFHLLDNDMQGMKCKEKSSCALPSLSEDPPASDGEMLSCGNPTMSCKCIECKIFGLGPQESRSLHLDMVFRQEVSKDIED